MSGASTLKGLVLGRLDVDSIGTSDESAYSCILTDIRKALRSFVMKEEQI